MLVPGAPRGKEAWALLVGDEGDGGTRAARRNPFADEGEDEEEEEEEEEVQGDLDPSKPWSREDMLRQAALQFGPIVPPGQNAHHVPSVTASSEEEGSRRQGK